MEKSIPFSLGKKFEKIIKPQLQKPEIAILELISNAWDAYATEIKIEWPEKNEILNSTDKFIIKDNGIGMDEEEFIEKWKSVGYDKRENNLKIKNMDDRSILGKNGRGRLGIFCFSDTYTVSTSKNGKISTFKIIRDEKTFAKIKKISSFDSPFKEGEKIVDGTYIECPLNKDYVDLKTLEETISIRFGANPNFKVYINNNQIDLFNFKNEEEVEKIYYEGNDKKIIEIYKIPKDQYNKKLSTYEVVWWVKNRYVDENRWKDLNINLNSNNIKENKYVFLICADFLESEIKSDWTGFEDSTEVKNVKKIVAKKINDIMSEIINSTKIERKKSILLKSKNDIIKLTPIEQYQIGEYIDEIIENCKSISNEDFLNIVKILTNMELSNKKYSFFEHIVNLSPNELDKLTEIVEKWSIKDAYLVLNELYNRLELIKKIDLLIDDPKTKEVQQLQPLFKGGLWIFNPKYEGTTRFTSNQSMNNVMKKVLGVENYHSENAKKRPDFVVTEDSTIGTYSSEYYEEDSEVPTGYDEILIVELKKGDSTIGYDEKEQAFKYAKEIAKNGNINKETKIIGYVLGTKIDSDELHERKEGNIIIYPKQYSLIIQTAKQRTYGLIEKIKDVKGITDIGDEEINQILKEEYQQKTLI